MFVITLAGALKATSFLAAWHLNNQQQLKQRDPLYIGLLESRTIR